MMDGGKPIESTPVEPEPVVVDYSLPENAQQTGVAQHELQYPVFEATGIPVMPEDPGVAFEDLIFTQRVFWFAQRIWNEGDYVNDMHADMQIMANDFNYNIATRNRSAVNAAFVANVGNLGAVETLRGYVNWILHVNDGKSISYWAGWHGEWLSIQEWYDTIVPANIKSSLVDPSG